MQKIFNLERKKFLTSKGFKTPNYIWEDFDSKGEKHIGITKSDLKGKLERIEKLRISNPQLFQ